MSAIRQRQDSLGGARPEESGEYVRVPAVIDAHGDKIVTLIDDHGRPQTRLIAELVLEAFRGPCPPGHTLRFKDGNRLNCELANLEWAPLRSLATRLRGPRRSRLASEPTPSASRLRAADTATAPNWYARIGSDDEAGRRLQRRDQV